MRSIEYKPIFEATRGDLVESIHSGAFAVVNNQGNQLASWGDPESVTYLRSSAKPFQAIPFMENKGDEYYGLTDEEIAAFCASHTGTNDHVNIISRMQQKMGLEEKMLLCGTHTPQNSETWIEMNKRGEKPTPIRHMCSGKHTGMLGYARMIGAETENYLSMDNPVQQAILKTFSEMTDTPEESIIIGIDGCSAPNFAVPLKNASFGFARLCQPEGLTPARASACERLTTAMRNHPNMIAGPGKFDTLLMGLTNQKIVSKAGAEGYQCLGVMPGAIEPGSPGLGIALKIADGDAEERARPLVALEILRQLGALTFAECESLRKFGPRKIYNFAKIQIGEYRPTFSIK
jgi:L-asparaginase II